MMNQDQAIDNFLVDLESYVKAEIALADHIEPEFASTFYERKTLRDALVLLFATAESRQVEPAACPFTMADVDGLRKQVERIKGEAYRLPYLGSSVPDGAYLQLKNALDWYTDLADRIEHLIQSSNR